MSRSYLIGIAAIAGVAMTPMAMAQDGTITVQAPRVVVADPGAKGVHPPQALVAEVAVQTRDLDLRTAYGRDVLDHRVKMAAREVCSRIDELYRTGGPGANPSIDSRDCRIEAARSAQLQVRGAHWAAG